MIIYARSKVYLLCRVSYQTLPFWAIRLWRKGLQRFFYRNLSERLDGCCCRNGSVISFAVGKGKNDVCMVSIPSSLDIWDTVHVQLWSDHIRFCKRKTLKKYLSFSIMVVIQTGLLQIGTRKQRGELPTYLGVLPLREHLPLSSPTNS